MKIFLKIFFFLFFFSQISAEIITTEGVFKHIGDISQKRACKLSEKRAKEKQLRKLWD